MRYVGLDVHQSMSAVCILDEHGKKEKQFIVRGRWTKLCEALWVQILRYYLTKWYNNWGQVNFSYAHELCISAEFF